MDDGGILLLGSVNVRACLWPTEKCLICVIVSWQLVISMTLQCFCLFRFFSPVSLLAPQVLRLHYSSHTERTGRWGPRHALRCGSFLPRTGPWCPTGGLRRCDSTGSLWSPVAHVHEQRWPAGHTAGLRPLIVKALHNLNLLNKAPRWDDGESMTQHNCSCMREGFTCKLILLQNKGRLFYI